jgi:hypothetical protein
MDNELGLLITILVVCVLLRGCVFIVSIGLSINVFVCVVVSIGMFSAMIVASVVGSMTWAMILAATVVGCVALCVFYAIMLLVCDDADKRLAKLSLTAYAKLQTKIYKHWRMLSLMIVLRQCWLFTVYTSLDEFIWVCYAAFADD